MNIQPTCRYGHGPLEEQTQSEGISWSVPTITRDKNESGYESIGTGPFAYSARLFRCSICGYLELFDDAP